MTADALAALVQARRTGTGKWQAQCPAHADRSPSLSICVGSDGRILLHCFAGCALDSILATLQLSSNDLFPGARPTPAEAHWMAQERKQRDAEARKRRIAHGAVCDRLRRLEAICDSLGAQLARQPDSDSMTELFHAALDKLRAAEEREKELRP